MYESQANYLKWKIKILGLLRWTFPEKLEIGVKEDPHFTEESPYSILIQIWFRFKGRLFRVALHTSREFDNLRDVPEAFLRAYKRTLFRIEREEKNNGTRSYKR